jgi:GTP-binding protein HSR1-related
MIDLLNRKYYHYGDEYGFIDMVLVIIEGSNRDMGTTYTLLNDVIIPNIQSDRILVAINQADMSMKGRNWNDDTKTPNPKLLEFFEEQADSIQNRVKESTGISILKPVYYSAEYGYNVEAVMNMIIDNIPSEKRRLPNSVKR